VTGHLDAVNTAIDALTRLPLLEEAGEDEKALVVLLADLRDARQKLHQLESIVEAATARAMTDKRLELPALGILAERKGGSVYTRWDHPRVAAQVARRYAVDAQSGEIDETLAEVAEHLATWLLDVAHVDYWRTTALRAIGLNPDTYATKERGRRTVHITRSQVCPDCEAGALRQVAADGGDGRPTLACERCEFRS